MASRSYIMALGLAGVTVVAAASVAVAHPGALNDWPYAGSTGQAMTYMLATVGDIACEPDDPENAGTPAALKCGSATLGGLALSMRRRSRPTRCTRTRSHCSATSSTR